MRRNYEEKLSASKLCRGKNVGIIRILAYPKKFISALMELWKKYHEKKLKNKLPTFCS